MDQSAVSARLIGLMFVERGLITEEQLEEALERQRATGDRLGEILVEQFGVERLDLAGALAEQWAEYESDATLEERKEHAEKRDLVAVSDEWRGTEPAVPTSGKRPIGEIFIERGLISGAQLAEALEEQKKSGRRLGEILVATGKLSRLELASALADQWASFQKLRPPGEEAPTEARMMPMPVASLPLTAPSPSPELTKRLDELASRVDELASRDGSPQPAQAVPEELAARVDQLESTLAGHEHDDVREIRKQLAELTARIEAAPGPEAGIEWRSELAEVAGNLRTRVERVEQGLGAGASAADVEELRASVAALGAHVDSLPPPSEEWREPLARLAARLEALPTGKWRPELEKVADKLRSRLERLEQAVENERASGAGADQLRTRVEDLAARVDALPVPSEEWREPLARLAARLDALPSGEWRPELAEVAENLRTRLERVEQSATGDRSSEDVAELRAALEELHSQLAGTAAELQSLSGQSGEWRAELGEVAGNLRARLERVEQGVGDGDRVSGELAEVRGWVEALAARVDSLPAGAQEEWRGPVAELAARVEALASDAWRPELERVAESLRARLERVEQGVGDGDRVSGELAEVRGWVEALAARADSLPAGAHDEWREPLAELAENLHARLERVELVADAASAPADVAELRARLEDLSAGVGSLQQTQDWRQPLGELAAQLDALRSGGWRPELAEAAESLQARVERLEQEVEGGRGSSEVAELRVSLEALAARADALATPAEDWREPLAELARRVDGVGGSSEAWRGELEALAARIDALRVDEWRPELSELAARVDAILASTARAQELAGLVEALGARVDDVERELTGLPSEELDKLHARIDDVSSQAVDIGALEARLRESLAALADERAAAALADASEVSHRLDEVAGAADRGVRQADELAHRVDELAARRDASEVEEALAQRLAALEDAIGDLRDDLGAVPASVAQQIAELDERAAGAAGQAAAEVASVRHELEDLRGGVDEARAAATERVDAATAALRDQLEEAARQAADGVAGELRAAVEETAGRIDGLAEDIVSAEQRVAGRSADLGALRARLETVESALAGALGWHEAVELAQARVEGLELRLTESFAAEAVERDDQIDQLRGELVERAESFERERVKRKDVRELHEAIEGVERRVQERLAEDAAAVEATEAAVRESLEAIGERLSASGDAYLESGRELSRSLAGLGLALSAADAHRDAAPRRIDALSEASVFLAFAPTPEGYRLVELEGAAPEVGGEISMDEFEGTLVVSRVGASPLPFDRRPCVYLEPAD